MCEVVSEMFSLGGWCGGKKLQFKIVVYRALVKPKNQPGWICAGSLMAEMKHSLHCR